MLGNKKLKLTLVVLFIFFLTGCKKNNLITVTESSTSIRQTNYSKEEQQAIDDGYQVGDYRIFLTEENKTSQEDIKSFVKNDFFEKQLLEAESQINMSKKINIITYTMQYSHEEERYSLGVFLVNTSGKNIQSIKMLIKPIFKNINEGEFIELNHSKEDFINLPNHGVVANTLSANAPLEYLDRLKENTVEDITFEIKDLEINGEKVSNEN